LKSPSCRSVRHKITEIVGTIHSRAHLPKCRFARRVLLSPPLRFFFPLEDSRYSSMTLVVPRLIVFDTGSDPSVMVAVMIVVGYGATNSNNNTHHHRLSSKIEIEKYSIARKQGCLLYPVYWILFILATTLSACLMELPVRTSRHHQSRSQKICFCRLPLCSSVSPKITQPHRWRTGGYDGVLGGLGGQVIGKSAKWLAFTLT
jgi:hypothetical protein